mmetsp:Transcript_44669/g.59260  ORF Transcript_44669/g.59260 Transcript_44669/m.59260 type:complete len:104 (-) Transcript_44669:122-433(-)
MEKTLGLDVTSRGIKGAFILSKMTVEKENEHGPKEYFQVKFVEFLEFIGRLAWFKFKDTDRHEVWSLHRKIMEVLKCIFKFINEQPVDPENADEMISDSDNEY